MCEATTTQEADEAERWKAFYDRIRAQIRDENSLYNQRIVWLITMQAFLFAALSLLVRTRFEGKLAGDMLLFPGMAFLIAFTGIAVALVCHNVLVNGRKAQETLERTWDDISRGMPDTLRPFYPHPRGRNHVQIAVLAGEGVAQPRAGTALVGRVLNKTYHHDGLFRSGALPLMFVFMWVVFELLLVATLLLDGAGAAA